jgi:peptide deformylase
VNEERADHTTELVTAFVSELGHWRDVAGLSRKALSERLGYDPSYVGKIESGNARPTADFTRRADQFLKAGGALWRRWKEYEQAGRRSPQSEAESLPIPVEAAPQPAAGLLVEHDHAELTYADGRYRPVQRRKLRNVGTEPVTRYLIRISVDRFPGDPERSNELYRKHPLTWDELKLFARCEGEQMVWQVKHDRDAFKEVWLLFQNHHGRFPLYPGESAWIEYGYTVGDDKWGTWFQRAVRLPTQRLSVELRFPADLDPAVWGMETSMTAEAYPFRTAIQQETRDGIKVFSWATDEPPLHARYRLEWNFRAPANRHIEEVSTSDAKPSEKMASIGIVQEGDPILRQTAMPFDLPREAEDARRIVAQLQSAIERATQIHNFAKGMGVAAPQIGISRAVAVVRTPDGHSVTLLNPMVIEEASATDEQYEGCWSFFDVRGKVRRPIALQVEHQDIDGNRHITVFERGDARLIGHEIDHLNGVLYVDRMPTRDNLVPVSEYRGTGIRWNYDA